MKYSSFNTPFEEEKNNFANFGQKDNQNFGISKNNISIQKLKNNLNPTKFSSIFNNDMNSNKIFNRKKNDNKKDETNKFMSYKGKKFINIIFNF